jgi:L-xylulokinase
MRRLLGIDAGSTVTKSVLFDLDGREVARASRRVALDYPRAHHVERDQDGLWRAVAATVREALEASDTDAHDVIAVGVTSHGDGVYLVDEQGRPTRPGIMSLDTRAHATVRSWEESGVSDRALELTGQRPWPSAPVALLAWLCEHEPDVVARSAWALPAKDMLRHRLTGTISTEPTEASLSFTNVRTQEYDGAIPDLYGLPGIGRLLAHVLPCTALAGVVTDEAGRLTGLAPGTPVAAGAHDVDCSAVGTGVISPGTASVVAGSFSINQVVSQAPVVGSGWCARNFVREGQWMNMSLSPTSSANMEWFAQQLCADELARGAAAGDPFGFVDREVTAIAGASSDVVFLPFLYGSPTPVEASGTFIGLKGWHVRGHLLRAVMEGIAFTHRHHVDLLAQAFRCDQVRLTGGASKSTYWSQLFADVLARPVEVTAVDESGALGVALLAGVAADAYASLDDAVLRTVRVATRYEPRPDGVARQAAAYATYQEAVAALEPFWRGRA